MLHLYRERNVCLSGNAYGRTFMYRMAQATKLKQIRESLGATQEGVTRRTRSLAVRTYVRAEDGERVTYGTAKQILDAVNELLEEQGRPPVTMDDLGLTLY
jgi:hypothetical protein